MDEVEPDGDLDLMEDMLHLAPLHPAIMSGNSLTLDKYVVATVIDC